MCAILLPLRLADNLAKTIAAISETVRSRLYSPARLPTVTALTKRGT